MQKYIQLEGFVKSNKEAEEAVVQHLAEKYKMKKEEVKKYVDGVTVNPEETYDFLDKVYAMTKTTKTKQKQRLVYVHVAEYCIERLAGLVDIVVISPIETTQSSLFFCCLQNPAYCIYKYKTREEEKTMAKIIKLKAYDKMVYAVQVEDNLYVD